MDDKKWEAFEKWFTLCFLGLGIVIMIVLILWR